MLVAGVGNIFLGDDGFGVEVARRLTHQQSTHEFPDGVEVADFGIRGVHLAYQLLDGYDALLIVDAAPRGNAPGTISVIEPDPAPAPDGSMPLLDAHGMEPETVLALVGTLADDPSVTENCRVLIVGCEPATVAEGIGLSAPVEAAVDEAVRVVRQLLDDLCTTADLCTADLYTAHPQSVDIRGRRE